jgi:hypothetical protein
MPGMAMGQNVARLSQAGPGLYRGSVTVVHCMSGRADWEAEVHPAGAGSEGWRAIFPFKVDE